MRDREYAILMSFNDAVSVAVFVGIMLVCLFRLTVKLTNYMDLSTTRETTR
jgi:hypothetical protein